MAKLLFQLIGFVCILSLSAALLCYQCGSSGTGDCQTDTAGMLETNMATTNETCKDATKCKYYKYCNETRFADLCIIERLEEQGQIHTYIRECSDRKNLLVLNNSLLDAIDPSLNQTACINYNEKMIYCVTLCNTDYCNGPARTSKTSAAVHQTTNIYLPLFFLIATFTNV